MNTDSFSILLEADSNVPNTDIADFRAIALVTR
jgi:hypothetical protein